MKLDLQFEELGILVEKMGADNSDWHLPDIPITRKHRQFLERLHEGITPTSSNDFDADFGKLLTHKGEQIVLYIYDTRKEKEVLLSQPENSNRFHIATCQTIHSMKVNGRFERYVITNRIDGKFIVESMDRFTRKTEKLETQLYVCKHCLSELNWHAYSDSSLSLDNRENIWKNFSLEEFFAEHQTFFSERPRYWDVTVPKGGYPKNWMQISRTIKSNRGWRCDCCNVNLSNHHQLLHVHHENGVTSDVSNDNLTALCVHCHSMQPYHHRMKAKYLNLIESCSNIRKIQKIGQCSCTKIT